LDTKDLLTLVGWPVTLVLGILSGGVVIPRLTKKRKVLAWAIMSEADLVPRELSNVLGLPVVLQVGGEQQDSLSTVTIRLGNAGNEPMENISIVATFGKAARVLNVRPAADLGEYAKHVSWSVSGNRCQVDAKFVNAGFHFELDFVLSAYEPDSADVDAPTLGVKVQRRDPTRWEIPRSWLHGFGLNLFGLQYRSADASMAEIASELGALRRLLSRQGPPR